MEKNYAPATFLDFFASFEGGMQSGIAPLLLQKNQVGVGINCSVRGGYIKPRAPFQKKNFEYNGNTKLQTQVETGFFQGGGYYRPDFGTESLIAQISGHLILFTEVGSVWNVTDVSVPKDFNNPSVAQVWMWQAEKWMIIEDGTGSFPIFFDGVSSRRSLGPSQLWGTTAGNVTPPNPRVIGEVISVTLTGPYTGQYNVPVIFNKEFYQPIANPAGYSAVLTNINDTPGNTVATGVQVVVNPNIVSALASDTGAPSFFGSPTCIYSTLNATLLSALTGNPGITLGNDTWAVTSNPDGLNLSLRGSCNLGPTPAAQGYKAGTIVYYAANQGPNVVVGNTRANFLTPSAGGTVTVLLSAPYSGPNNAVVVINGALYSIAAPTGTGGGTTLNLINLTDESTAVIDAGSTIVSVPELPAGRMGAYGMGCNCVTLTDGVSYIIGDVVGSASGTPANNYRDAVLKTTNNTFLAGGGTFRLPGTGDIISAVVFPPVLDTSLGQGPLQIGTAFSMFSNVVPGTDPASWETLTFPIQTESLKDKGPLAQNSTILVNSDTFFRSYEGFGSLVLARRDFVNNSWGNKPISNEMQRILSLDNQSLLPYGSAITFDNRFLGTCAPNVSANGVFHVGMASLNFDLLSSLRTNLPPSWEGAYTGLNALQLVAGRVNGTNRAFAFTFNVNTTRMELYELLPENSSVYADNGTTPITWFFETPVAFNQDVKDPTILCELRDGEVYISNIKGTVDVQVYYKPDFYPCWTLWREFKVCSDLSGQNANPSYRMRIGLGEPAVDAVEIGNNRPLRLGYFFQFRVVITGFCTWNGMRVRAVEAPTPVFAPIEQVEQACQALDCFVPADLRVYSLQGLPPQPLVPVPTPPQNFTNSTVFYENVCPAGRLISFEGTLPNWITIDNDNNQVIGAAGTFRSASQLQADAAAQAALNTFVNTNLNSGQMFCGGD